MNNIVLSPVPLEDLLSHFREIVKQELKAREQPAEKLLSPAEACKLFEPTISKVTLNKWTSDGLIPMQKIGGRVYYKLTDITEAGTHLKKYKNKL